MDAGSVAFSNGHSQYGFTHRCGEAVLFRSDAPVQPICLHFEISAVCKVAV